MARYRRRLGPAGGQKIPKGAVILQAQVGVAAGPPLLGLLLGQPLVLVVQLVAQAIQHRIESIVDQAPFAEAQGRLLHQALAQLQRQRLQLGPGTGQGCQRTAAGRR